MQEDFNALVQKATQKRGSQAAVARLAGITAQQLTDMIKGRRPVPLAVHYNVADLAGLTQQEIAQHLLTLAMRKAGKVTAAVLVGAVATLGIYGGGGGAAYAAASGSGTAPMYIM